MPDKRSERMGGGNGRLVRGVFFTPFRLPKIPPCSAEENAQERGIASLRSPFGQPAAGYLRCASVPSPQHTASTCGSASPLRPRTFATSALVLSLFCLQPPPPCQSDLLRTRRSALLEAFCVRCFIPRCVPFAACHACQSSCAHLDREFFSPGPLALGHPRHHRHPDSAGESACGEA
jgi:hypothetical protein